MEGEQRKTISYCSYFSETKWYVDQTLCEENKNDGPDDQQRTIGIMERTIGTIDKIKNCSVFNENWY